MPYTPDPTDVTNPIDGVVKAATAAPEFRSIKTYLRDVILAGLNLRAPIANPVFTGRIVGADIHNNASGASGASYIASGTYVPTFTVGNNVTAVSSFAWYWIRVGNVVTVSGTAYVTVGAEVTTDFIFTLPIDSARSSQNRISGTGSCSGTGEIFVLRHEGIQSGPVPARGEAFRASSAGSGIRAMYVNLSYLIA